MTTRSTHIAYLKRMLRRLDEEDVRIQHLVSTGNLSAAGGKLSLKLIKKSREELRLELQELESKGDGDSPQSAPLNS